MYPILRENISLGVVSFEGESEIHYYVRNEDGDEYELPRRLYHALKNADGTHSVGISSEQKMLLEKRKIITTSRFVFNGLLNRFIILAIGKRSHSIRFLCQVANRVLSCASIPFFLFAATMMAIFGNKGYSGFQTSVYYGLLILSIAAHEAGHLSTAVSYGYDVTDIGLLLLGIVPIGAYVAYNEKPSAPKNERIQLSLAGIEANLFVAGIFMLLSMVCRSLSFTFAMSAFVNVLMATINAMPINGLDGGSALGSMLGVENVSTFAKEMVLNHRKRRRLMHSGTADVVRLACASAVLLAKVLF